MKGREIINNITQEKMPNIQQVREQILYQPIQAKRGFARLRLSTAAAIVAALIVFASAAYAVAGYQRVTTGGAWDIVILPNDEYGRQIYNHRNQSRITGRTVYWALGGNMYIGRINAETAQFINESLEGQIFTASGTAIDFELAVSMPGALSFGRHYLYDKGYTLYTADGYPVGSIILFRTEGGEPYKVYIRTKAHEEELWGFNSTYEEVQATLGEALRLPTAYIEIFQPPCFDLHNMRPYSQDAVWRASVRYSVSVISDIFDWCQDEMRITIESVWDNGGYPIWTIYYLGGEAIAHDIAGVTVYELNLPDTALHFMWVLDGLAYRLTPSPVFTPGQTMDVIYSMIAR